MSTGHVVDQPVPPVTIGPETSTPIAGPSAVLSKRSNLAGVRVGFYAGDPDIVIATNAASAPVLTPLTPPMLWPAQ